MSKTTRGIAILRVICNPLQACYRRGRMIRPDADSCVEALDVGRHQLLLSAQRQGEDRLARQQNA